MIFVDASAIVAVLLDEPEAKDFSLIIDQNEAITLPIALFEAAQAISRQASCTLAQSLEDLRTFLAEARISVVAIPAETFAIAIDAAERFGKGRGHPAQLNLGDCFAYAGAYVAGAKLLYKGNDFVQTDITTAAP